ncbi:MAG: DUF2442 domain-containing protein [Pyrinomonadaceae bacterium]|nr:DUF2442 domain-containing protein [Pyrinomonadaceae bacterium]
MSDEEFERQLAEATKRGEEALERGPRARDAYYDRESGRIVVELLNGCTFMFPTELAQGLRGASPDDLAEVKLMGQGSDLHWDKLDVQFTLSGLMAGFFGNQRWMSEIASQMNRKGVSSTPEAKQAVERANGKKGERPAPATRKRKSG